MPDRREAQTLNNIGAIDGQHNENRTAILLFSPGEMQQQVLYQNTLLLEYAMGEVRRYLISVRPRSIKTFTLPEHAELRQVPRQLNQRVTAWG